MANVTNPQSKKELQNIIDNPKSSDEDKALAFDILNGNVDLDLGVAKMPKKPNVSNNIDTKATQEPAINPAVEKVEVVPQKYTDTSTVTKSNRMPQEQVDSAVETAEKQKEEIIANRDETGTQLSVMQDELTEWSKNISIIQKQLISKSPQLAKKVEDAADSLKKSIENMQNLNIDPFRYQKNMSTAEKVLSTISQGLLIGMGKPDVVGLAIDKAVERDIEMQKYDNTIKLRQAGYDQNQINNLIKLYEKNLDSQKINMLEIAKVRIAQSANASKRADLYISAANQISLIDKRISDLYGNTTVTESSGSKDKAIKLGGKADPTLKADKLSAEESKRLMSAEGVADTHKRVLDFAAQTAAGGLVGSTWAGFIRKLPGEQGAKYNNLQQDIVQRVKDLSGVAYRENEFARIQKGFDTGFQTKGAAVELMTGFSQRSISQLSQMEKYHRARGQTRTADMYSDSIKRVGQQYNSFLKKMGEKQIDERSINSGQVDSMPQDTEADKRFKSNPRWD
jgi:hypothetical protein